MGALLHKGPAQEPYEITWQLRQIIQRWKRKCCWKCDDIGSQIHLTRYVHAMQ